MISDVLGDFGQLTVAEYGVMLAFWWGWVWDHEQDAFSGQVKLGDDRGTVRIAEVLYFRLLDGVPAEEGQAIVICTRRAFDEWVFRPQAFKFLHPFLADLDQRDEVRILTSDQSPHALIGLISF